MLIESTFIPLPNEIVIPFAAHQAHVTGKMTFWGVVLAGTLGSWAGAAMKICAGFATCCRTPAGSALRALFPGAGAKTARRRSVAARFGPFGVLAARLLPVVRHQQSEFR